MIGEFKKALLQIDRTQAANILKQCYQSEGDFSKLEDLVIKSLEQIGIGWENATISLAQVYMSGVICEELMADYLPKTTSERKNVPRLALAVLEDHHILGKRIVSSVLRAGGYPLLDLGHGLSPGDLVTKVRQQGVDVLLISTLMLPSALKVAEVKKHLGETGQNIKIVVGGAPFRLDCRLWRDVGADATGDRATEVIDLVEKVWKA